MPSKGNGTTDNDLITIVGAESPEESKDTRPIGRIGYVFKNSDSTLQTKKTLSKSFKGDPNDPFVNFDFVEPPHDDFQILSHLENHIRQKYARKLQEKRASKKKTGKDQQKEKQQSKTSSPSRQI